MPLASIIPVLDVQGGQVVQAVGGIRREYRPLVTSLADSAVPERLALALRDRYQFQNFYLADLDAIAGWALALTVYRRLASLGLELWVDAGIADVPTALAALDHGAARVIVALESLIEPSVVKRLLADHGPHRVTFSLDLVAGRPLTKLMDWRERSPLELADWAISQGVMDLIVLDLAAIGRSGGPTTLELCHRIHHCYPHVHLYAGGGIRNEADLEALAEAGVCGALVATALHQGQLHPDVVQPLRCRIGLSHRSGPSG
jgi:phosphoribosylformimino-5-aminoimidazole carboxamide ribotide isomerase